MIGVLLAFIGFMLSPIGLFVWGLGLVAFLLMPTLPAATGRFKGAANVHLWLALWAVQRAAIVVTEHGELLFKRMEFDDLGVEQITFGSDTKDFEDPATALHHWMNYPFALADEVHGVLFDPRHAALGARKDDYDNQGIGPVRASEHDYNNHGIDQWLPGVFELPESANELVDVAKIRSIIDGGERAEYPARIEEIYKLVRKPYDDGTSSLRLLVPVVAFIGVLAAMWQISANMSGGSGGPDTVVTGSFLTLVFTLWTREDLKDYLSTVNWTRVGLIAALVVPVLALELIALVVGGPLVWIVANIVFLMGFTFLPFLTLVFRPSATVSGGFARHVYLRLGLIGYQRPVLEWQPTGYRLKDADELDINEGSVDWFGLAGSLIGFSYQPGEDTWGADVMNTGELEMRAEVATDGGYSELPTGWVRAPSLQRDVYGAYIPKPSKLNSDSLYLDSHIALKRMTDAAVGEKSLRKLLWAKEEYGDGNFGLSDRALLWATMGSIVLASAIGVPIFFL